MALGSRDSPTLLHLPGPHPGMVLSARQLLRDTQHVTATLNDTPSSELTIRNQKGSEGSTQGPAPSAPTGPTFLPRSRLPTNSPRSTHRGSEGPSALTQEVLGAVVVVTVVLWEVVDAEAVPFIDPCRERGEERCKCSVGSTSFLPRLAGRVCLALGVEGAEGPLRWAWGTEKDRPARDAPQADCVITVRVWTPARGRGTRTQGQEASSRASWASRAQGDCGAKA